MKSEIIWGHILKLSANIALTGTWTPVGSSATPFTGSLDGNGKSVSGLLINDTNLDYAGLFAYTNAASIKNLSLTGVAITGKNYVAGFVAKAENNTLIEACRIDGAVTGNAYVASFIAYSINSKVENFYSTANVSGTINVAGIVAVNSKESAGNMVFVEGGTFQMGSTTGNSNEQPVHSVTLSSFYIGKYEVTQADWQTVMTGNNNRIHTISDFFTNNPNHPMQRVSWYDIMVYCNHKSIQEELTPCYAKGGDTNPDNWEIVPTSSNASWDAITCNWSANGYRLPTEAEWEYAARGGNQSQGYTYSGSNTIGDVAWLNFNSGNTTHSVGTKAPNELGIYDMSCNVWEWCWDWYGLYTSSAQTNPTGPTSGLVRLLRSGGFYYDAGFCRVSYRHDFNVPYNGYEDLGFRISRTIP
jgi:formylglycine-generating enzyme required for sulfatase activity